MLTKESIVKIIEACRIAGKEGLRNGTKGIIPQLKIDFLAPPADFLGKAAWMQATFYKVQVSFIH